MNGQGGYAAAGGGIGIGDVERKCGGNVGGYKASDVVEQNPPLWHLLVGQLSPSILVASLALEAIVVVLVVAVTGQQFDAPYIITNATMSVSLRQHVSSVLAECGLKGR